MKEVEDRTAVAVAPCSTRAETYGRDSKGTTAKFAGNSGPSSTRAPRRLTKEALCQEVWSRCGMVWSVGLWLAGCDV